MKLHQVSKTIFIKKIAKLFAKIVIKKTYVLNFMHFQDKMVHFFSYKINKAHGSESVNTVRSKITD